MKNIRFNLLTCLLLWGLLLGSSLGLAGQNSVSLDALLARIPSIKSPLEVDDPKGIQTQLLEAFEFQDQNLPEAQLVLYQLFSYASPASAAQKTALLQQMSDEVFQTLWADPLKDSLAFESLQGEVETIIKPQTPVDASFEQKQAAIALRCSHYLMRFFYQNPNSSQNDKWATYLKEGQTLIPVQVEEEEPAATKAQSKSFAGIPLEPLLGALAFILLSILLVWVFLNKVDKKSLKKTIIQTEQNYAQALDKVKKEQDILKERLASLEAHLKEPEDTPSQLQEAPAPKMLSEAPAEIKAPEPTIQTFFAVTPKNGLFFGRQLSPVFREREHIYRIEVLEDEQAYYYLVEDETTRQHAFNIPDNYIRPAMELEGVGRLAEANTLQTSRGVLKKVGNNWQIEEKAVLNYA